MVNPYLEVKDENGDYIYDPDILDNDGRNLEFNFIEEMKNTSYSLKNRSIKPMITLDYKVTSWLRLFTQFSMQLENSKTEKIANKNLTLFGNIKKSPSIPIGLQMALRVKRDIFCLMEVLYSIGTMI